MIPTDDKENLLTINKKYAGNVSGQIHLSKLYLKIQFLSIQMLFDKRAFSAILKQTHIHYSTISPVFTSFILLGDNESTVIFELVPLPLSHREI